MDQPEERVIEFNKARKAALIEVLSNKRRILDEEVAYFKTLKDNEFRAFESAMRMVSDDMSADFGERYVDHMNLRYKIKKPKKKVLSPNSAQRELDERLLSSLHVGILGPNEEAALARREARLNLEKENAKRKEEKERQEREKELRGIFTPSYLPLLGTGKERQGKENRGPTSLMERRLMGNNGNGKVRLNDRDDASFSKEEEEREQMKKDIAAARRTATPILSSSAECQLPALTSPPAQPPRPLSSSVPPEHQHSPNQRRSLSRSDVSMDGRRSSLKNPSQPKSPKRVQFSIDNTVVSPSTSPLIRRSGASSAGKHSKAKSTSQGDESFEVIKGQRGKKSSSNGPSDSDFRRSSIDTVSNNSNAGMSSLGRYFNSKQDLNTSAGPVDAEESFDILDGVDDVFSFDEDIDSQGSSKGEETSDGTLTDDVEEGESERNFTGSSPHAGSLPIEIKLPARRGQGGE